MSASGGHSDLQSVLDRARGGEDDGYEELISISSARLLKLTRKMFRAYPRLRRWEQTDDVYQRAVWRLYRSLGEVRPDSPRSFLGLAATQIRRTLIELARHHFGPEGSAAHHHTDAGEVATPSRMASAKAEAPDGEPEALESWVRFHELVETLPSEEREVFALAWYSGLDQTEIAKLLEISVPTVKRRWRRARLLIHERADGQSPQMETD